MWAAAMGIFPLRTGQTNASQEVAPTEASSPHPGTKPPGRKTEPLMPRKKSAWHCLGLQNSEKLLKSHSVIWVHLIGFECWTVLLPCLLHVLLLHVA